eukprot:Nitzschia sp. Nitz4//scaffold3_size479765//327380//328198//NITZ4_000134-RA/size479765-processed-gene-1.474-mRNA-1//1//CDS//3329550860//1011//frame0
MSTTKFLLGILLISSTTVSSFLMPPVLRANHLGIASQGLPSATFLSSTNKDGGDSFNMDTASSEETPTPPVVPDNNIIQALEKKEAQLGKKREAALEQLNQLEASLSHVQNQKTMYLNGLHLADSPPGGVFSETTMRSAVKAFCWRVIAGSVTFATSLRISGSLRTALTLVGSDFFSKAFTMFVGERLMNKSTAGRKSGKDNAGRSLAKALIWRLFAVANTLTMAIFIAKDLSVASKIAGIDAVFKTSLMFFYERAWARIEWGKDYLVEFAI